jgi:predicted CXXCH cytochrome family protein
MGTGKENLRAVGALARLGLVVVVALLLPVVVAEAAPKDAAIQEPGDCVSCHPAQGDEWHGSPHATAYDVVLDAVTTACSGTLDGDCACLSCHTTGFDAQTGTFSHEGVTCEACHGAYQPGHENGGAAVTLDSDSCICENCHSETEHQWEGSPHAAVNIQCISCHDVHSQQLRQPEETLCESCHRTEPADTLHATHLPNDVTCTDCHFSPVQQQEGLELRAAAGDQTVINHKLNPDTSTACIVCHSNPLESDAAQIQPVVAVNEAKWTELTLELDETRTANRQLQALPFVTLGVGLGIGVMMGAIVVLAIGMICQRRGKE